jgi:asparagine synthase (glutamine-hydrolysing)
VYFGACDAAGGSDAEMDHRAFLPRIAAHPWGRGQIVVEGETASIVSGGQGALLCGRLLRAADLAAELGVTSLDPAALLLHAYRRWGTEFPRHVHGEVTFAVWDGPAERLVLGRDASGYSPLFYRQTGGRFVFASDVNVLRTRLNLSLRIDERHVARWLALAPSSNGSTFYEGIECVRPGQQLVFERGRVSRNFFWQPEQTPTLHLKDPHEYTDGLRHVLQEAIRERLPQDSAAGAHLSGGLDSSSVTALAASILKEQGRRLFVFTAIPEHRVSQANRFCDEGPYAASMLELYKNLDPVVIRNGSHPIFPMMDLASSSECRPILSVANYGWIHEINLQAYRRGVRTLLTGSMGNLTISYDGVLHILFTLTMQGRLLALARMAGDLHRHGDMRWRGIARQLLNPWLPAPLRHAVDAYRNTTSIFQYSALRPEFARAQGIRVTESEDRFNRLDAVAARLLQIRSMDYGIPQASFQRMTGVSTSDPTADPRVASYCFSVPAEYFCQGGVARTLIRQAMEGWLPDQIRLERRRGLQAADFRYHFQTERQEALAELARMKRIDLAARALDLEGLDQMMQWPESRIAAYGESVYWAKLMRALSLGRFLRRAEEGTFFTALPQASCLTETTVV